MTAILIICLFMVLCAVAVPAVDCAGKCGAVSLCIILMALLAATAGVEIQVPGLPPTNFGNVLYAAVTFTIGYAASRYQQGQGIPMLIPIAVAMILRQFVFICIDALPVNEANADFRMHLEAVSPLRARVAIASLIAFYVSQAINIRLTRKWCRKSSLPVALVGAALITHLADSLFFFPIAFPKTVWSYMIGGFAIKVGLACVGSALLWPWMTAQKKDDEDPCD